MYFTNAVISCWLSFSLKETIAVPLTPFSMASRSSGVQPASYGRAALTAALAAAVGDGVEAALRVDVDEWRAEVPQVVEWFATFGDKLPGVLWAELDALRARLALAADLGDAREAGALTTWDLAEKAGVPTEDVERIERGDFGRKDMPLVAALAESLGLYIRLEAAAPG